MHQYLDAIGFKNTFSLEAEIELLLDNLYQSHDSRQAAREETPGCAFLEMSKSYGAGIGIRLCGQIDSNGFHRTYYFPYLERTRPSLTRTLEIGIKSNGQGYSGLTEDSKGLISISFFVQNPAQLKKNSFRQILSQTKVPITLTGLSREGMILLGHKAQKTGEWQLRQESSEGIEGNEESGGDDRIDRNRKDQASLFSEAGTQEEDQSFAFPVEDLNVLQMLSRRIEKEDIYTIVETSFMPEGLECDEYRVVGTILFYAKVRNTLTRQYVYQLTLECNGLLIDVCINQQDLVGDPDVGRRFKGRIWLQGMLHFETESRKEQHAEEAVDVR